MLANWRGTESNPPNIQDKSWTHYRKHKLCHFPVDKGPFVKQKVGTHWYFLSGSASSLLNVWFIANPFPFLVSLKTYMKTRTYKKCYVSEGYHILPFQLITSLDICYPLLWFLQLQEGIKDSHSQFLGCFYDIRLTVLSSRKYVLPKLYWLITERKVYNNWKAAS